MKVISFVKRCQSDVIEKVFTPFRKILYKPHVRAAMQL